MTLDSRRIRTLATTPLLALATLVPCVALGASADITSEGTLSVSSVFGGSTYPASLSVDGDTGTSWFSDGTVDGDDEYFEWTGARNDLITEVRVLNNADNDEGFFGFGFVSVTVEVLDDIGDVVYSEFISLPGATDPDFTVFPNVVGRTIKLNYSTHDDPGCGGFSEIEVFAERDDLILAPVETFGPMYADFEVLNATPGETIRFFFAKNAGTFAVPSCAAALDLNGPKLFGTAVTDSLGVAWLRRDVPWEGSGKTRRFQALEHSACEVTNVEVHTF